MAVHLGPLYHWSPRGRLGQIKRRGLIPGQRNLHQPAYRAKIPTEAWELDMEDEDGNRLTLEEAIAQFRQGSVCFGTSPGLAWELSHFTWKSLGVFDLWEVWPADDDEVRILPNFGPMVTEVRVYNRIPKRRCIWVGERTVTNPRRVNGHP